VKLGAKINAELDITDLNTKINALEDGDEKALLVEERRALEDLKATLEPEIAAMDEIVTTAQGEALRIRSTVADEEAKIRLEDAKSTEIATKKLNTELRGELEKQKVFVSLGDPEAEGNIVRVE
jgi:hypothetical protein